MAVPRRAQVRSWLFETANKTAHAARRALRARDPQRIVQTGASGSPTSALDRIAEQVLIRELKDAPIPLNLCSEEIGNLDRGAEWWLVADPVDGTRNALHGVPFYAVSLAISRRDLSGTEMGLVHSIPTQADYYAEKGRGATYNGKRIRRARRNLEPLVGTALDYERGLQIPRGERLHFRDLGSAALEMCLVATGGLDAFYCDQQLLRIVDIAASTLILRESGGHVLDLAKKPLNVPFDVRVKFPMVALGDQRLWGSLRP